VVFALELLDNLPYDKVRDGFEGSRVRPSTS